MVIKAGVVGAILDGMAGCGARPDLEWAEPRLGNRTALHLAAYDGNAPLVAMLLARGANPAALDANQSTALHVAATSGFGDVAAMLSRAMRDDAQRTLKDAFGRTARDLADASVATLRLPHSDSDSDNDGDGGGGGGGGGGAADGATNPLDVLLPRASSTAPASSAPLPTTRAARLGRPVPAAAHATRGARSLASPHVAAWQSTVHAVPDAVFAGLPASGCHFDVVDQAEASRAGVFPMYASARQPFLIRGGATKHKAFGTWSPEHLAKVFGGREFTITDIPYAKQFGSTRNGTKATMRDYFKTFGKQGDRGYLFVSDITKDGLDADFDTQPSFMEGVMVPLAHQLALGPANTGAPFHHHRSALNSLYAGRKLWLMSVI